MKTVVEIDCLKHSYPDGTHVDLCNTKLKIERGEWVLLTGANGSGKTTLLFHIVGMLRPSKGKVRVFGASPGSKKFERNRRKMGVVFQDVDSQLIAPTVEDDVAFSPLNYGMKKEKVKKQVDESLKNLKIEHLRKKVPHYLSGGEKRKVAFAGALIINPELLIVDEGLTGLDAESKKMMLDYLAQLNKKGMTIVMATHDFSEIEEYATKKYHITKKGIHTFEKNCSSSICSWQKS